MRNSLKFKLTRLKRKTAVMFGRSRASELARNILDAFTD